MEEWYEQTVLFPGIVELKCTLEFGLSSYSYCAATQKSSEVIICKYIYIRA